MPATADIRGQGPLPRSLRVIGISAAGVLLTAFFIYRGFPYDALADRISTALEQSTGIKAAISEAGPAFQLAGPAVEARGMRFTLSGGETVALERALLRPAWALSWLFGIPAVHIEMEGEIGETAGTLTWDDMPGWKGTLLDTDLGALHLKWLLAGGKLDGRADATLDLQGSGHGVVGDVNLVVRGGSLSLPALDVALPFELLTAELTLGGDDFVTIQALNFEGPIVSGTGSGKIARAPSFEHAALDMEFRLSVKPALAGAVRSAGLKINRQGETVARVTGTVSRPTIR